MPIKTACPFCQQTYTVPEAMQGKRAKCKACSQSFEVMPSLSLDATPARPKPQPAAAAAQKAAAKPKPQPEPADEAVADVDPVEDEEAADVEAVDEVEDVEEAADVEAVDEEDDRPRSKKKSRRGEDDDEDEDRPAKRKRDDDEEEDDEDDRPRGKKKKAKAKGGGIPMWVWLAVGGGGLAVVGLVVVLIFALGGSAHESVIRGVISCMSDLADALESVKDKDSAKAAAPKINKICDRMEELAKKGKSLGEPPTAEAERLEKKYKPELEKQMKRLVAAQMKVALAGGNDPDFQKAIQRLASVGASMGRIGR
jgi:hypothetical protein